ncbi:hypothetical protein HQQ80_13630 [Microbacteriaceae bacterium VKM Ac-2855]|nr:hypothetical protein [Microbacteriaceae bacterium VKM Ac-2855]
MNDTTSTNPSDEEKDRVDDLPTGAGEGDTDASEEDTASGGAPDEPGE